MQFNKLRPTLLLLFACLSPGYNGLEEKVQCNLEGVTEDNSDDTTSHRISVRCSSESLMRFSLTEGSNSYELKIEDGSSGVEWLGVEHRKGAGDLENDLFITIDGETFNVKDGLENKEEEKLESLLKEREFRYFTQSVKVIHDELELKGWESPVVMLLYNLALSAERLATAERIRDGDGLLGRVGDGGLPARPVPTATPTATPTAAPTTDPDAFKVDPQTWDYHGLYPKKSCKYNGWYTRFPYFTLNETNGCPGICGPACHTCWMFVCGDCCYHKGCSRHDKFCDGPGGYKTLDCTSMRGVLWDTLTDTTRDC